MVFLFVKLINGYQANLFNKINFVKITCIKTLIYFQICCTKKQTKKNTHQKQNLQKSKSA